MQTQKYALIIDDEPEILDVLCYEIGRTGLKCVRATSPQEARTRLGFHPFDLIVTDIMMPKENGIQFLVSLHQSVGQKRKIMPPVVIITAMDLEEETRERLTKLLRVELILQKPWDGKLLRQYIEKRVFGKFLDSSYATDLINIFLNATLSTIENIAAEKPTKLEPFVKRELLSLGDMTGLIHFTGAHGEGSVALSFRKDCCQYLAHALLSELKGEISESILHDATVEITNLVAQAAQQTLEEAGTPFELSKASVVVGEGHRVEHSVKAPCLVLPFVVNGKEFFTEFVMTMQPHGKS